ncbi:MAG: hypothetical protein ACKVZH_27165 [Blastocatellia bacterium]
MPSANKTSIVVEAGLAAAYNSAPQSKQKAARQAMQLVLNEVLLQERREWRREEIQRRLSAPLSKKESELLTRINHGLAPDRQNRYIELRQKREDETLAANEETELIEIVEELENIWAARLQALIALAKLRKTTPQQLMNQLQIGSDSNGE